MKHNEIFNSDLVNISELRGRITELEVALARANNSLTEANAKLRDIENETTKATPMIDFDTMRVFSIERNVAIDKKPCTIIGYYMNDPVLSSDGEMVVNRDEVKEWTLYCNEQRHEELVKKFIEWKKQNGN